MQIKCGYFVQENMLRLRVSCQGSWPSWPPGSHALGHAGGFRVEVTPPWAGAAHSTRDQGLQGPRGPGGHGPAELAFSSARQALLPLESSVCAVGPPALVQAALCSPPQAPCPHSGLPIPPWAPCPPCALPVPHCEFPVPPGGSLSSLWAPCPPRGLPVPTVGSLSPL